MDIPKWDTLAASFMKRQSTMHNFIQKREARLRDEKAVYAQL
jgi:hypothetical protein